MALPGSNTIGLQPVIVALAGNSLLAAIKLVVAFLSGSSAMFSQAVHSLADAANQTLLLIGLRRSRKKADEHFGYGYGLERFFWATLSACGVFFVGAGVTIFHGVSSLIEPNEIEITGSVIAVLIAALFIELCSLYFAIRTIRRAHPKETWRGRLKHGDPATVAVLYEDSVAVIGVVIAAVSIFLSYQAGNAKWDAVGSLLIGLMLAIVAIVLIVKNRSYLIGRSIPRELKASIIGFLEADPMIEEVIDFKSAVLDVGVYRIKCEVEITGSALLREAYRNAKLQEDYEAVKDDFEEFKRFCVDHSNRIPRLIGKRIDEVEARLKRKFPAVRHIDIEIN